MTRRTIILLAVLSLAVLGTIPAAFAAEGAADVGGTGNLWARGTGLANIRGGGTVRMDIEGDVRIVDNAGDARVWISGRSGGEGEPVAESSEYVLDGFHGHIRVTGSDIEIAADGRMRFQARGTGTVLLRGSGVYRTWSGVGRWTRAGLRLELGRTTAMA
jgi:hypothetical protein